MNGKKEKWAIALMGAKAEYQGFISLIDEKCIADYFKMENLCQLYTHKFRAASNFYQLFQLLITNMIEEGMTLGFVNKSHW